MIVTSTVTDQKAYEALRSSLFDLLFLAPLAGLCILGASVNVKEAPAELACDTMCTDGREIYYAPSWVHQKSRRSNTFDLLHEFYHIFYNHPARRGSRDPKLWNYCCDIRVAWDCLATLNTAKGQTWVLEPDHVPAYEWAKDMSVEEIYNRLLQDEQQQKEDAKQDRERKGLPEPAEGEGEPERKNERPDMLFDVPKTQEQERDFLNTFKAELAQAVVSIETSKGDIAKLYGTAIRDRLAAIQKGGIPWELMLQGRLTGQLGHEVATWSPPNRRYFPDIVLPGHKSRKEKELILGFDVSASIDDIMVQRYISNVLPAARRAAKTTVITFDSVVRECVTTTRPEELLRQLKFRSGHHSYTCTKEMFEIVEKRKPTAVAVLTDGYIRLPDRRFQETNWVITPEGQRQPWGRNYMMQLSW